MSSTWTGYNNVGICASALGSVLVHSQRLSLPKALLVMPLVMHDATVSFLGKVNVRKREAAALASTRPDLFANFARRFDDSLVVTLNAIQLLESLGVVRFDGELALIEPLPVDAAWGRRALRIQKAAPNISALIDSPVDELYLNLRIPL